MTKDEALKLAMEAMEITGGFDVEINAIKEALAQPEFVKHEVENADDWSEWVCPDPKGYLMKCCDCGLVHEAEFGVVRYKSETEREYCDMVDDPNLQAVFRMRRSEQWSPEDTAHRAGGLPMAQPEQEPVAAECKFDTETSWGRCSIEHHNWVQSEPEKWPKYQTRLLYTTAPQRKPLTDGEIKAMYIEKNWYEMAHAFTWGAAEVVARAIEAAHGIKENT